MFYVDTSRPYALFSFLQLSKTFNFLYPPQNEVLGGYTVFSLSVIPSFRDSVIPSFRHSVNIWTSLLNNLSSFWLICFKFSPHLHHQTIHVWYEFRGQRVSIARVMGLFKSSYNMFIPPAKRSFRGVYCFQPVRHSVIP